MRYFKLIGSIVLILFLFSPIVLADEYSHTLGGKVAPTLNEEELKIWVDGEIAAWQMIASEQLNADAPHLSIQPDDFQFNSETSVEKFLDRADVPWYAFWKSNGEVHQPLDVRLSKRLIDALDADPSIDSVQSSTELQVKASVLSDENLTFVMSSISVADMERVAFVNQETGLPSAELNSVIDLLNKRVLQPQEVFSLNETLTQGASPISEDTANFVASMLYKTVLQTEFSIVERHSQGVVPTYSTLGLEAMVNMKLQRDFQFKNTFDTPVTINSSNVAGVFLLEFYTLGPDSSATFEVGAREEIEPKRIERLVADLAYGAERRIQMGQSGWRVTTFRTISSSTGSFEKQEVIARDYYPPVHEVHEVSTQPAPPEATTPIDGQSPGDTSITNPDGSVTNPDGTITSPDGTVTPLNPDDSPGSGNDTNPGSDSGNGTTPDSNNGDSGNGYDKGGNKID